VLRKLQTASIFPLEFAISFELPNGHVKKTENYYDIVRLVVATFTISTSYSNFVKRKTINSKSYHLWKSPHSDLVGTRT
jgi:hypothetical protein